jgi:D-threo-aldose 1-dehydrogenase
VVSTIPGAGSPAEVAAAVETLARPVPGALYDDLKAEGLMRPEAPTPR